MTSIGQETLFVIFNAHHPFILMHNIYSVHTAGKTLAPLSFDLTNGTGTDVLIQMHLDMPDSGTHLVTNSKNQLIPFTALVNFFHELSHARHKINGSWLSVNPEGQAVEDENIFRQQFGLLKGHPNIPLRDLRYSENDQQIWFID